MLLVVSPFFCRRYAQILAEDDFLFKKLLGKLVSPSIFAENNLLGLIVR